MIYEVFMILTLGQVSKDKSTVYKSLVIIWL